jgi:hypothetical protein
MEKMNMEISKPDKSRIDALFTGSCSKTMLGFDYLRLNNKRKDLSAISPRNCY